MNEDTDRKIILLVDDAPENIDVLSAVLRTDYVVKVAINGTTALDIAVSEPRPDMILLDIIMPEMDGYEVIRHLKSDPATAPIPVIFVTAKTEISDEKKGFELGAVDYITKPFSPPIIKARVHTHITLSEKTQELESANALLRREVIERKSAEHTAMQAKADADVANRAKTLFLANMSHEIRTPMNAILGFSELLHIDPTLSQAHKESLEIINNSGNHLLSLINDVLDISKIEAGQMHLQQCDFSLKTMLKDMEDMFRFTSDEKGLDIKFQAADSLPDCIKADEGKLRQVLVNLLGNAVKFTRTGHVDCRVSAEQREGEAYLLGIEVQDTGPGIAETEQDKVFATFEQTESGMKSGVGTGLGLSISRGYARLMGGDITFTSEIDVGTVFRLTVAVEAGDSNLLRERRPSIIGLNHEQEAIKILVIGDKADHRRLVCEILRPLGFSVVEARDAHQGLSQFEDERPDLVLIHVLMTAVDILLVTKLIKAANVDGSSVPIIALTASAFDEECQAIMELGLDAVLCKPFKRDALLELIGQHLRLNYEYGENGSLVKEHTVSRGVAITSDTQQSSGKVLIIDDVSANRMLLSKIMTAEGYSCHEATNGKEALEELEEWHPDIALLDIQMPVMDGYEVLRRINALPHAEYKVPIIAVTANSDAEEVEKLMSLGAVAVCRKPIVSEQMKGMLRQHISHVGEAAQKL